MSASKNSGALVRAKSGRSLSAQNCENGADRDPLDESGLFYIIMYSRQKPDINMTLVQGERSAEFGQFRNKSNVDNAMLFVITNNPYYFLADLADMLPLMHSKPSTAAAEALSRIKIQRSNAAFLQANSLLLRDLFPKLPESVSKQLQQKPQVERIGRAAAGRKSNKGKKRERGGFYCDCSARSFSLLDGGEKEASKDEGERTVVCVMGPIVTRQVALVIYRMWSQQLRGPNSHTARGVRLANEFGVHIFINPYGLYMVDSRAVQIRELRGSHTHRANVCGYSVRMVGGTE